MKSKEKKEIIVLDEGLEKAEMASARGFCCRIAFAPFR